MHIQGRSALFGDNKLFILSHLIFLLSLECFICVISLLHSILFGIELGHVIRPSHSLHEHRQHHLFDEHNRTKHEHTLPSLYRSLPDPLPQLPSSLECLLLSECEFCTNGVSSMFTKSPSLTCRATSVLDFCPIYMVNLLFLLT